nr:winged helix-turn-helix domain-containing protein [Rhizobium sp. ARZ01]
MVRSGAPVAIRAKTFLLLSHLAHHRGKVLSKNALLDAIWPDVSVTEDSLTQCIRDARKALGDEAQQLLRTVTRRGYVLTLPDATGRPPAASPRASAQAPEQDAALHRPPEPTVAVLPFSNTGDNPEDALFIDGIVEEIHKRIGALQDRCGDRPKFRLRLPQRAGHRRSDRQGAWRRFRGGRISAQARLAPDHRCVLERGARRASPLGRDVFR